MKKNIVFATLLLSSICIGQVDPNVNFDDFDNFEDDASTEKCKDNRFPYAGGPVDCISGGYYLIFDDEFNGFNLYGSNWKPYTGVPRDFELTSQKAWHLPENNVVSDGTLKITAKKLNVPYTGTWVTDWTTFDTKTADFDYSTGEIWSKYRFHYGVYEIRCKIPKGRGFWPAFWTSWGVGPTYGEIDVFEFWNEYDNFGNFKLNKSVKDINTNMWHFDFGSEQTGERFGCSADGFNQIDVDFNNGFHTVTMIYDPGYVAWLVDGIPIRYQSRYTKATTLYRPVACEDLEDNKGYYRDRTMPDEAMHIVANLAIQCGIKNFIWPIEDKDNAPDESTIFPQAFEIDYIRYWKKFDCPSALYFPDKESLNLNTDLIYNTVMGTQVTIGNAQFDNDDQLHIIYSDYVEFDNVEFSGNSDVSLEYFSNFDCSNQGIIISGDNTYDTQEIKDNFYSKYENETPIEVKPEEKLSVEYILYDLNGRIIQQGRVETNVQFPDLKKGMYIYIEFDEKQRIVKHQKLFL